MKHARQQASTFSKQQTSEQPASSLSTQKPPLPQIAPVVTERDLRHAAQETAPSTQAVQEQADPHVATQPKKLRLSDILKRIAVACYVLLVLGSIVFSLGLFTPFLPTEQVNGEVDAGGSSFSGEYRALEAEYYGDVEIVFSSGNTYTGGYSDGRLNGAGRFVGAEGWSIEGNFVDGKLEGEGVYTGASGTYRGTFKNSLPDDEGEFVSVEGWSYRGGFSAGVFEGEGVFTLADGSTYAGTFSSGYADGLGEVTAPTWSYIGDFTVGYRDGQGKLTFDNGEVIEGIWTAGYEQS